MMFEYIKFLFSKVQSKNERLKDTVLLQDKTWVRVTPDGSNEKWFFRSKGVLIISKNGDVIEGRYEFINEYLRIHFLDQDFLIKKSFMYKDILLLNKDDYGNEISAFFDESKYSLEKFFELIKENRKQELNVIELELIDNTKVEVTREKLQSGVCTGNTILLKGEPIKAETIETEYNKYELEEGKIKEILYKRKYSLKENNEITVLQKWKKITEGDRIISSLLPVEDDYYIIGDGLGVHFENDVVIKKFYVSNVKSLLTGKRLEIWNKSPKKITDVSLIFANHRPVKSGIYFLNSFNLISVTNGRIRVRF